jgi:hypothetical protein
MNKEGEIRMTSALSNFSVQQVEPLLNGLQYPFPVSCHEEDGVFITKFYPDFNYFGRLGLHPEGAIYTNSKDDTQAFALIVLYAQNVVCCIKSGYCVICGSYEHHEQIWSNWRVAIDEFDEYREPQNPTNFPELSLHTEAFSDITQFLSASFCCAFEYLEHNLSWEAVLMPAIGLKAIVTQNPQNQKQFYVELNLCADKIYFGLEKYAYLKYEISPLNELLFIGFEG